MAATKIPVDLEVTGPVTSEGRKLPNMDSVWVTVAGTLTAGSGLNRIYLPYAATIVNVHAAINTAPTGASAIFDVNKNGTTIFTTQGNRPTIAVSTNVDATSAPDVTAMAVTDYLTVDVDQIGSTVAGANAVIRIDYVRA